MKLGCTPWRWVLGALLPIFLVPWSCQRTRALSSSRIKVNQGENPFIHSDPKIRGTYWIPNVIVGGQVGKSCTGFAVGPRKVLTAAHCLWSEKTKNFAKAGDVGLNFTIGSSMLHYKVESLSPHPFYVPEFLNVVTGSFDLAVLTLAETLDPRILALKPAVVTETTAVKQLIRKKSFIFMGYGGNNQLMMGTDIPIPNSICLTDPQVRAKTLRISCSDQEVIMFCAGPDAQDAKITKGDSGGPAFLIENGVPMVFGMSIAFTEKFSFFETFDRKDTRFWLLSQIKE